MYRITKTVMAEMEPGRHVERGTGEEGEPVELVIVTRQGVETDSRSRNQETKRSRAVQSEGRVP